MSALIASLSLVLTLQQPNLSAPITFESVAMPAKRLVAEFGKKAGLTLDTSAQTAGEILVLRVQERPIQEVLDRVALAVNGEWKQEEGLMRLIRPAANLNREVAAERTEKAKAIQKEIQEQIAALNKKPAQPNANEPPIPLPFGLGGDAKEIVQLLARLSPGDLVLSEKDSRVVFSSSPTRMQKLLPGNLEALVTEMVAEHNRQAAAKKQDEKEEPENEEVKKWIELMKAFGYGDDPKPIDGRPAKLLLVVEEPNFIGGVTVALRLYDAKGQVALEKQGNLGMSRFMEEAMEMSKPKPVPPGEDKAIEYTPETVELNALFQSMGMGGGKAKLSAGLETKLGRPDLYDPLSFGTSESLLAAAKVRNLNLVANLPDTMTSILGMFTGNKPTVNGFMQSLESMDVLKMETANGWLTVTPKWPNEARKGRADRVALTKLINAVKAKGGASLDDMAAYAQTSPSPLDDSAVMTYFMLFAPSAMQGMYGMLDWNALKFYGTLDVNQRQTLSNKGRLMFSSLSPAQKDLATRMLYGAQSGLKIADPNEKPKDERGFMELIGAAMSNRQKDYRQEPTEVMPFGIPGAGFVAAEISKEPVGQITDAGAMYNYAAIGADELAMFRFFKDDPNMAQVAGMMPTITQLKLGERTNITLKFFVADGVLAEKQLQDQQIPKDAPLVSMDKLPPELLAKIEKRLAAFKKMPFPGFPGAGVRPPP